MGALVGPRGFPRHCLCHQGMNVHGMLLRVIAFLVAEFASHGFSEASFGHSDGLDVDDLGSLWHDSSFKHKGRATLGSPHCASIGTE